MVLKRISTRNIQNHREVIIDLPPSGLVVFTGNNSNGKSVIVKATKWLMNGSISDPERRAALVNRKSVAGEICWERDDGATLLLHVQREAAPTYVELTLPGADTIRRYIADKSWKNLVEQFGWYYDKEYDLMLQLASQNETLLFYATPGKTNTRALSIATTDPHAETAAEYLTNTIQEAQKWRNTYSVKITTILQTLNTLKIEDSAPLEEKLFQMQRYYRHLSTVYFPSIPEIHAVPDVKTYAAYIPSLPKISYPRIYEYHKPVIDSLSTLVAEIKSLNEMRCPTCGRRFEEHAGEDSVCV